MSFELTRKDFIKIMGTATAAAASGAWALPEGQHQNTGSAVSPEHNIKWSYMDHWTVMSPRGWTSPFLSLDYMDRYIRQLAAFGFTGFETFAFRLPALAGMFGSLKGFEDFLRDHGLEKLTGIFVSYPDKGKNYAIADRSSHDLIFAECETAMKFCDGLSVENFVVQPANSYWQVEPVTDDKLRAMADLWNRVGRMTLEQHGIKTACHHEFWCAISRPEEVNKFYQWTDPRYVHYWCDTAQTVIAGLNPTELYNKYHERTTGFHFKDTHHIDTRGEYRLPPDPELMAPSVERWFYEMGTPEGKVDFLKLMAALRNHQYKGWISVEHDKVEVDNASYAEATGVAKWYIDNVLSKIYA